MKQLTDAKTITDIQATLPLTPYRALRDLDSSRTELIPSWAEARSVYRSVGRTRYVAETTQLQNAQADLDLLREHGWNVTVERFGLQGHAQITMTAGAVARVA